MQVSQTAFPLLDVGLELIAAVADPPVPRIALGELGLDELRRAAADDVGIEAPPELAEERLVAP